METLSRLHFLARFYHAFSNPLATLQRNAHPITSRKKVSSLCRSSHSLSFLLPSQSLSHALLLTSSLNCVFLNGPRSSRRGHGSKIFLDSRTSEHVRRKGKIRKKQIMYIYIYIYISMPN